MLGRGIDADRFRHLALEADQARRQGDAGARPIVSVIRAGQRHHGQTVRLVGHERLGAVPLEVFSA